MAGRWVAQKIAVAIVRSYIMVVLVILRMAAAAWIALIAALVVNLTLVAVYLSLCLVSLCLVSYTFASAVGFLWMVGKAAAAAAFSVIDEASNSNNDEDDDSMIDSSSGRPLRRSVRIAAKKSGDSGVCQVERPLRRSARIAAKNKPLPRSAPIAASGMRRSSRLAAKARVNYHL